MLKTLMFYSLNTNEKIKDNIITQSVENITLY